MCVVLLIMRILLLDLPLVLTPYVYHALIHVTLVVILHFVLLVVRAHIVHFQHKNNVFVINTTLTILINKPV